MKILRNKSIQKLVIFKKKLVKFKKYLFKFIIYFLCAYQYIQLVIDYTKFEMNNEYRLKYFFEDITLTFCFDHDKYFNVDNLLMINGKSVSTENNFFIATRYFRSFNCYSYVKYDNYSYEFRETLSEIIVKESIISLSNYPVTIYLIAHSTYSPSHFGKLFYLKPKRQFISIYTMQPYYSRRELLTWPFATNCFDYNSPKSKFKSREYCYLDVMKKLELKYCKVNKYWTMKLNYENNITKCIEPDYKLLERICQVNCIDVTMEYAIRKNDLKVPDFYFEDFKIVMVNRNQIIKRLYLEYSPKFSKKEFLSAMGGLIGLWLGLSIYDLLHILFNISQKFITDLLKFSIPGFKLFKYQLILKIIIMSIMMINLQKLFLDFSSGQTITKINIVNEVDLIDVNLVNTLDLTNYYCWNLFNNMVQKYLNLERNIYEDFPIFENWKEKNIKLKQAFEEIFLKEIIFQYGFDYYFNQKFMELTHNVSCTIVDHFGNYIDCSNNSKYFIKIEKYRLDIIYLLRRKSILEKINSKNIKKIIIQLNPDRCYMKKIAVFENVEEKFQYIMNVGTEMNIKFQKISLDYSKTSLNEDCIWFNKNNSHDNYDCQTNFMNNILINKLNVKCMPRNSFGFYLNNMKLFNNSFCKHNELIPKKLAQDIFSNMSKYCPQACESEILSVDVDKKLLENAIRINLIPKPNRKPIFTYYLSMDFNNFIYNIGGTIGMWAGYSALTIPNILYELWRNYQIISIHMRTILNISRATTEKNNGGTIRIMHV